MATVIDSLVVQLGLNPANFKKGQQQASKSLGDMTSDTKKASGIITKSLQDVGRQVAVLFLGFESAVGFMRMLGGLNTSTADLGRTATNLNMSAHVLNQWGQAVELAGGKAEDAYGAFQNLSQSITEWKVSRTPSPLLALLSKLKISWMDNTNHARKYTDILEELRQKMQRFSPEDKANLLSTSGMSGLTNLFQLTDAQYKKIMEDANSWNAVNEESIRLAKQLQEEWRKVGQQEKGALQEFMAAVSPDLIAAWNGAIDNFSRGIEASAPLAKRINGIFSNLFAGNNADAYEGGKKLATDFWAGWLDALKGNSLVGKILQFLLPAGVGHALKDVISGGEALISGGERLYDHFTGDATYGPMITAAEKQYGIPHNLLQKIAYDESGFKPDVISGKTRGAVGEIGIMQLRPEYFPGAGQSPQADIKMAAKHLADLHRQFAVEDWGPALAAFNDGAGNVRSSLGGGRNAHRLPKTVSDRVTGELAFAQLPRSDAIANAAWDATRGTGATPNLPGTSTDRGGLAGALASARGIGATPNLPERTPTDRGGLASVTNNSSTQIDMTVNTHATDGNSIALDLKRALQRKALALQTDSGMN